MTAVSNKPNRQSLREQHRRERPRRVPRGRPKSRDLRAGIAVRFRYIMKNGNLVGGMALAVREKDSTTLHGV